MVAPARLDRLERVTDLVLVLLNTSAPLTLDAIAHAVPGYPDEHGARRQAFERDKRLLRDEGIPVLTEPLPGSEQFGYRIEREAFSLPDLGLEPDEQVALQLAVAGVHLGDPSGRDALLKLGATGLGDVRPIATLVAPDALVEFFEAVRVRAEVTFSYRGIERRVAPAGLWFRFGHWYLVAFDLSRLDVRTFRVDRVHGEVTRAGANSAALPEGIDISAALPDDPWVAAGAESDLISTRIKVDALEGPRVAEEVGESRVEHRESDGAVQLAFSVASFAAIRSWVLGLGEHAEILEPAEFRSEMRAWLGAMVDAPGADVVRDADGVSEGAGVLRPVDAPADQGAPRPGRQTSDRLRRLLAIVGWLAQVGEAAIDELALRFGMDEAEVVRELELAACCGVPPYTPDALMEIEVSETTVRAFLPPEFARPRRLTPAEGFAVAASARLILSVPGAGDPALTRALAKLEGALGSHAALGVDVDDPPFLGAVRAAVDSGAVLEIDYHSASRDESTTRVVEPHQVITKDGHWYLDAYCRKAGDTRRFRVDRLRAVRVLAGEGATSLEGAPRRSEDDGFVPGPGAVEVELALGKGAQWVAESVPVRALAHGPDGLATAVVLDVAGLAWFERLLLQVGVGAQVVRPAELVDLGARAAQRLLARYEVESGAPR